MQEDEEKKENGCGSNESLGRGLSLLINVPGVGVCSTQREWPTYFLKKLLLLFLNNGQKKHKEHENNWGIEDF